MRAPLLIIAIAHALVRLPETFSQTCNPSCDANNGRCVDTNTCICLPGWTGPTCTTALCTNVKCAARHGICTAPDVCTCFARFTGQDCSSIEGQSLTNHLKHIPEYSYVNDGNVDNWLTYRSWTTPGLIQPETMALRVLPGLASRNSYLWSKMAFPLTEFSIKMTVEHKDVKYRGDGLWIAVISNQTALHADNATGYFVQMNTSRFVGMAVRFYPYAGVVEGCFSGQIISYTVNGANGFKYNTANLISNKRFIGGNTLTIERCDTTSCIRLIDKRIYTNPLPINDSAPAVFGIAAADGGSYGIYDFFDMRVFTLSSCKPSCGFNGICYATNKCFCRPGWTGNLCNQQKCGSAICSEKAYCVAGKCQCFDKWKTGAKCTRNVCDCQNLGRCVGPQLCQCGDVRMRRDCSEP